MFSSFLAPSTTSRSRSKSPGGRERERSRSRDGRSEKESEPERRRSRKSKYSESESEADVSSRDKPRYEEIRPSKGARDVSSDEDRSRRKSSRRKDDSDTDVRKPRISKSSKSYDDRSDDDSKYRKKSIKKAKSESESSDEDDRRSSRTKVVNSAPNGYNQGYTQPAPYGYSQNSYAPPPGAFPSANDHHGEYAPRSSQNYDPRYAPAPTNPYGPPSTKPQYAQVDKYQYAQPERNIQYKPTEPVRQASFSRQYDVLESAPPKGSSKKEKSYVEDRYKSKTEDRKPEKKYYEDKHSEQTYDTGRRGSYQRERPERETRKSVSTLGQPPASEINRKLARLSVAGVAGAGALGAMDHASGGRPPASPLLEAYKGTYQSISPMPSPLALVPSHKKDDDLSDLDLDSEEEDIRRKIKHLQKEKQHQLAVKSRSSDSDDIISPRSSNQKLDTRLGTHTRTKSDAGSVVSTASGKQRKTVLFYDPEPDAKDISAALQGTHRAPDIKPLVRILPYLTIDDLDALKIEYKKHAKINGQGINMSKHIKARILGNLGKVCYATSLGVYESDAFWANCFYQSGASRRELLIESLIGRSNQQIREIKDVFKDKRYDDDLEQCMKAELKADKFRTAILLALEERRMPENLALDIRMVKEDVIDLYQALNSAGGESAMIKIIILRSDSHLREVLRVYEKTYNRNFARDMIGKSKNLVGETLAHVLNGALNRPMRDALLLHQAIAETAPGKERAELLISRIVRLHWDPKHMERVKDMYESRYRVPLEVAIKKEVQANMKTEEGRAWTQFCIELVRSSDQ